MIVVSKVLRCLAAVPLILALSNRAIGADVDSSYSAEVYRSEGFLTGRQRLLVFPLGGDSVTIPLPIPLGWVEYNASGTALYVKTIQQSLPGSRAVSPGAQSGTVAPGLFKIEFNPIRVAWYRAPRISSNFVGLWYPLGRTRSSSQAFALKADNMLVGFST